MSQNNFKLRINTLSDRLNFVAHGAALGASCVAISYFAYSPVVTVSAAAVSLWFNQKVINYGIELSSEAFPATYEDSLPLGMKRLPLAIRDFSRKLGLKSAPILHLYDSKPYESYIKGKCEDDDIEKAQIREAYAFLIRDSANVLALNVDPPVIIFTPRAVEGFHASENAALAAHEVAHIALKHPQEKKQFVFLNNFAVMSGIFCFLGSVIGSLPGIAILAGCFVVGAVVIKRAMPKMNDIKNLSSIGKSFISFGGLSASALLVTGYLTNRPEVLTAFAAAAVVMTGAMIIGNSRSRHCEYQADRISAELTGEPNTVAKALKKIEDANFAFAPQLVNNDYTKGGFVQRQFKRAKALLFFDHPLTEMRCLRLKNMARHFTETNIPELR